MSLFKKVIFYSKNILALKKSDVFLVSFPKSGNTWVRFYLGNLINQLPQSHFTDEAIDFKILDETMVELGFNDLTKPWPFQGFPRIIKTHLAYNPLLGGKKTILVVRDPKDVMVSFYKYETTKTNHKRKLYKGNSFHEFIRKPEFGIEAWCKHYLSWKPHAHLIIKYEDIKLDDKKIFAEMNNFLSLSVSPPIFEKALKLSRFENIKKIEVKEGSIISEKFGDSFQFARSGKTGQWKEYFSAQDIDYLNTTLKKYSIDLYQ